MTDLNDGDVLKVLQNEVKTAVAASDVPTIPVKFLGRSFTKPNDDKWLELIFIPNNQDNYWGDETLFQGIFRIALHWPLNDKGAYEPFDVIASVVKHFKKTTPLHGDNISLQIYQKPIVGGMITEASDNIIAASMSYRSFQL